MERRQPKQKDETRTLRKRVAHLEGLKIELEDELNLRRKETESTIENFTQLCEALKWSGLEEVEDLECNVRVLHS